MSRKPAEAGAEQTAKPKKFTAADVREALRSRWPSDQHVFIDEAPDDPMRQGRKLDVLVISTWRSRGFELDGVEVKVSMSDFKREVEGYRDQQGRLQGGPEKADWWWEHVHRFWLAMPAELAVKARNDVPTSWGLLAVTPTASQVLVKPVKHDPTPFTWPETVGLFRAACNAGPGALQRRYDLGYDAGVRTGRSQRVASAPDVVVKNERDRLAAILETFKEASGIDLADGWGTRDAERIGHMVAMLDRQVLDPADAQTHLRRSADDVRRVAERIGILADRLAAAAAPLPPPA